MAFSQIFPYVNEFMSDLHLTDDPSQIGNYSGLVVRIPSCPLSISSNFALALLPTQQESAFAIAQSFTIYKWAQLSGTFHSLGISRGRSSCALPQMSSAVALLS